MKAGFGNLRKDLSSQKVRRAGVRLFLRCAGGVGIRKENVNLIYAHTAFLKRNYLRARKRFIDKDIFV